MRSLARFVNLDAALIIRISTWPRRTATLRIWALSLLVEDRQDARPSYHQYINALKDKVSLACLPLPFLFVPPFFLSLIFLIPSLICLAHHTG